MTEFYDPSPAMIEKIDNVKVSKPKLYEEEFEACPVGKSFIIPLEAIKETTLRPLVSRMAKAKDKKFRVLVHDDKQVYEIYRVS